MYISNKYPRTASTYKILLKCYFCYLSVQCMVGLKLLIVIPLKLHPVCLSFCLSVCLSPVRGHDFVHACSKR